MHIPDGFIDARTALTSAALAAGSIAVAARNARASLPPRAIPLMGLTAAFVFVAQMLNFPVAAGTSGHLLGAVLAAILVGPHAAVLVMTSVIVVQSLLFADGGLLALGANTFNLAILAPLSGYWIFVLFRKILPGDRGMLASAAFAGWCSTVLASIACAGELAWSGTAPWQAAFPAMTTVHMLVGVGEGAITALVLTAIRKSRPDLLRGPSGVRSVSSSLPLVLALVLGLALFVSPFASPWPDGLEKVAASIGFESRGRISETPLADYTVPGIGSPAAATALAAGIGTLVAFLLALLLARILLPNHRSKTLRS